MKKNSYILNEIIQFIESDNKYKSPLILSPDGLPFVFSEITIKLGGKSPLECQKSSKYLPLLQVMIKEIENREDKEGKYNFDKSYWKLFS